MTEPEYYTLKKPLPHDQIQHWSYVISDDRFNDAFVSVDVDTIRQQIELMVATDSKCNSWTVTEINDFADAVLRVCCLTQEGTDV
jgi:hypothetical protein